MTEVLSLAMQIVSSISVVASMTVVFIYHRFPHLQKKSYFTLQYQVAISSALTSIGSAIGVVKNGTFACWFQGFDTNIFTLSSIQWTTVMVMSLYSIIHYEKQLEVTPLIHCYCWIPPILATVLPLINSTYGNVGNWCWVINTNKTPSWGTMFWFWFSFYGWVWFSCLFMLALLTEIKYFNAKKEAKSAVRSRGSGTLKKIISTLNLYPLVILFSWGPACVSDTMSQMFGVYYITFGGIGSICACSQGILTALIFWMRNDEIKKLMPHFLNRNAQISDTSSTTVGRSSYNESLKSVSEQVAACVSAISRVKGGQHSSKNNGNESSFSSSLSSQTQIKSNTALRSSAGIIATPSSKSGSKFIPIPFTTLSSITTTGGSNPYEAKIGTSLNQMTKSEAVNDIECANEVKDDDDDDNNVREFQSPTIITAAQDQLPIHFES